MNKFKILYQVIQSLVFAAVPLLTTISSQKLFGDDFTIGLNIIILIVAYVISAVLIFLVNKYLSRLKCFRLYKNYEGRWIEIIPGFEREISVCSLSYKNGEYHFNGENYASNNAKNVRFTSKKFIDNGETEFFYITEGSQSHRPEGYGKIHFISNKDEGYYKAYGYFFDVSAKDEQKQHKTIMIKFEKSFYDKYLNIPHGKDPEKFSDREIYEYSKEYIEKTYCSLEDALK
ncbi:MAG: hypothetical protein IJA31_06145 [Clostridia bacterium]|nr:hypothetical protein [Clostridia bacterium]